MSRLLNLAHKHKIVFRDEFVPWLHDNEHVYKVFAELADALWSRGRHYYSSRTIGEKMRFDHGVSEASGEFKLNNNYTPDLGRLYVLNHPTRLFLFSYRDHQNNRTDFEKYVRSTFRLTLVAPPRPVDEDREREKLFRRLHKQLAEKQKSIKT